MSSTLIEKSVKFTLATKNVTGTRAAGIIKRAKDQLTVNESGTITTVDGGTLDAWVGDQLGRIGGFKKDDFDRLPAVAKLQAARAEGM